MNRLTNNPQASAKFVFLRTYKEWELYETLNNTHGSVVEIIDPLGASQQYIPFDPNDTTALNKAIEKAKQWIDQDVNHVRRCRVCGCTDHNCQQCIEKTGSPCYWVEDDLCSACVNPESNVNLSMQLGNSQVPLNIKKKDLDKIVSSPSNNTTMSLHQLQFVKLSDINASGTNHLQREKWELEEPALKELAESIAQKGVIQPIMLRPNGKPGKYFLVCGERRYQASLLANKTEIPAFIKDMTDEEAFDLQITENLQRKDVHPMKEAQAYKALIDANPDKNTVPELAHRFGKSEAYITQRLAFNNLIPEMKKEFFEGKMLIGHAQLFCRLQPVDQKEAFEECKNFHTKGYQSIDEVEEWIDDEIMHVLSEAPFDKKDPQLVPKAGPCTTCPKQSGGNLLFSDIKEKDRCFDGKCYGAKKLAHTIKQINSLVLTEPAMPVVKASYEKNDPAVDKILKDNKIKVLLEYNDYNEASKKDKGSTMALCVGGHNMGKIIGIKFKTTEKAKAAKTASAESDNEALTPEIIDHQIAGIKERTKRSAELDMDKVHHRITERLKDIKPFVEQTTDKLSPAEYNALVFMAYERSGYDTRDQIKKLLKIKNVSYRDEEQKIAEAISNGSDQLKNYIIRKAIANDFISLSILPSMKSPKALLVRKVAEGYPGIPIAEFEAEQKVLSDKRDASASKRIVDLQKKKKELKPEKPKPKKSAAKK